MMDQPVMAEVGVHLGARGLGVVVGQLVPVAARKI